ncbi:MAG: hypothetical protein OEY63_02840 [Gemmatimonadota bacterium]|nr:hypothetical protein [Gemmatimonadota bacterium]MDH5804107.1 hypothetical protein [Gemmatimonadota bacterium]
MARNKPDRQQTQTPSAIEQARDELFSHILRCGVLEANDDHKKEWFDDTMAYLGDRYENLSEKQLAEVRRLGEQYCRPVIRTPDPVTA